MASTSKYGIDFAEKVYTHLTKHNVIGRNHYGYCGVGFVLDEASVLYTHFDEWLTYRSGKQYAKGGEYIGIIETFKSKVEFIAWLSEQSDDSLSGKETGDTWYINNQRVTQRWLTLILERGK